MLHTLLIFKKKIQEHEERQSELAANLERERSLRTGSEAIRNAEYLKHVVLKWMVSVDRQEQERLLPVISEMLQLSEGEKSQVHDLLSRGPLRRVAGGFKNLILGGP